METGKEGAKFVYNFAKKIIDYTGPRLPGSEEEAKAVPLICEEMEKATGNKAVIEPFTLYPRASLGAISLLGSIALTGTILSFVSPFISLTVAVLCLIFAIVQVFTYSGKFDFLFKKSTSNNVYSTIEPASGDAKYTIMFSGHNDSSWCWKLALKNPDTMIIKLGLGIFSLVMIIAFSIMRIANNYLFLISLDAGIKEIIYYALPILCIPGFYFLTQYVSWDKTIASPGAMDNLTGVGFGIFMAKYYHENPDKQPKNCRIICAGLGSEEAGLKGSMAFVKKHKDDGMLNNLYLVNLDSIRDWEHFNVIKGDLWLGSHFDENMVKMGSDSMKEVGRKGGIIINPVGGCDSTSFYRKGVKTVTMIAQNPVATNYYHTSNDTVDGLDMNTLEKFTEALVIMTDKVAAYAEQNLAK